MKITLKSENVQEDVLSEFIVALEHATGCHVKVVEIYELEVSDPKAGAILQTVFDVKARPPVGTGRPPVKEKKERKHTKRKSIYYTFLTGERKDQQITGGALGVMLKAGSLESGTRLSHPTKNELFVARDSSGKFSLQAVPA